MAGPYDLTGQNIENTYQRVLQTPDGLNFYDGTGSAVTFTATAAAGGSNTQIQFNSASLLSGSSNFSFNYVNNNVILTGSLDFAAQVNAITNQAGRLKWNDTDGTLDLGLKGGNVTLQIGQEQVIRVVNKTGTNLLESDYKVVRIRRKDEGGSQGQRLAIVLAQGNNDPSSVDTLGLVTENIDDNQEGFITTSGLVRNINTTSTGPYGENWQDGDILYLSPTTAGALTNIKPQAPNHTVTVGYVVYAHQNNGKIFVKVDNGYELDELHNVNINTSSLATGDLLIYDSGSKYWKNSKILSGSYTLTGSLTTNDGVSVQTLTASFVSASGGITGSLFGTSSYAVISSYPINVTGSILYSSAPVNIILLGLNAGVSASNAQFSNFIGQSAGNNAVNAQDANFIGRFAGYSASNAQFSNFIGQSAGSGATLAQGSNFIGQYAGLQATNAEYSNFIGKFSGYLATWATNSNFIGQLSGVQAYSASYSNFIGNSAGGSAVNANNSNFLGLNAGNNATNASSSNFMGRYAGAEAANTQQSNFFGEQAGYLATNARNSNFLGQNVGYKAANASYSNLLGYNVGNSIPTWQSGSSVDITSLTFFNIDGNDVTTVTSATTTTIIASGDYSFISPATASAFYIGDGINTIEVNLNYYTAPILTVVSYDNILDETTFTFSPELLNTYYEQTLIYPGIGFNNIIIGTNISLENNRTNSINIGGIIFGTGSYSDTSSQYPYTGSANGKIGINVVNPNHELDISGSVNITGTYLINNIPLVSSGIVTLDFGSPPGTNIATASILTSNISDNSSINIYIMNTSSVDHNTADHQIFALYSKVIPGNIINNTSFDITCISDLRINGTFKAKYIINN